jgi:hypothetical protein
MTNDTPHRIGVAARFTRNAARAAANVSAPGLNQMIPCPGSRNITAQAAV